MFYTIINAKTIIYLPSVHLYPFICIELKAKFLLSKSPIFLHACEKEYEAVLLLQSHVQDNYYDCPCRDSRDS